MSLGKKDATIKEGHGHLHFADGGVTEMVAHSVSPNAM